MTSAVGGNDQVPPWETQYKLALESARYQDQRRWTLFSVYVVLQGLGIQMFARAENQRLDNPLIEWAAWVALFLAVLWQFLVWRSTLYLTDRTVLAAHIEAGLMGNRMSARFYDEHAKIPDERARWQEVTRTQRFLRLATKTATTLNFLIALPAMVWFLVVAMVHGATLDASTWTPTVVWRAFIPAAGLLFLSATLSFGPRVDVPQPTDAQDIGNGTPPTSD